MGVGHESRFRAGGNVPGSGSSLMDFFGPQSGSMSGLVDPRHFEGVSSDDAKVSPSIGTAVPAVPETGPRDRGTPPAAGCTPTAVRMVNGIRIGPRTSAVRLHKPDLPGRRRRFRKASPRGVAASHLAPWSCWAGEATGIAGTGGQLDEGTRFAWKRTRWALLRPVLRRNPSRATRGRIVTRCWVILWPAFPGRSGIRARVAEGPPANGGSAPLEKPWNNWSPAGSRPPRRHSPACSKAGAWRWSGGTRRASHRDCAGDRGHGIHVHFGES